MKKILIALLVFALFVTPSFAQVGVTPQQFFFQIQALLGPFDYTHDTVCDYAEPVSSTAAATQSTYINFAGNTTNTSVNLSNYFPAITSPAVIVIQDFTTTTDAGIKIKTQSGSPQFIQLAPNGVLAYRTAGSLPTFFIDNISASVTVSIKFSVIGS